jgi:acetyltransferase
MGGADVTGAVDLLNQAGIATNDYPDAAARLFTTLWRHTYNLRGVYETPSLLPEDERDPAHHDGGRSRGVAVLEQARRQGRELLSEVEAKQVLASHGIPVLETRLAQSLEEALEAAAAIGYPVVLKLHSERITHKSDVGGVWLDLGGPEAVRHAWETMARTIPERCGPEAFAGVSVQAMLPSHGALELIVGGGAARQRRCPAAPEHHPGAPSDGTDAGVCGPGRCAWRPAR